LPSVTSLACGARDACIAGGAAPLHPGDKAVGAAVATQNGGTWGPARLLDTGGLPAAQPGQPPPGGEPGPPVNSQVTSVSCTPTGDCLAAGFYNGPPTSLGPNVREPFLSSRKSGTWSAAGVIPGLPALDGGRGSSVAGVVYSGAGQWVLTGTYEAVLAYLGGTEPFVTVIPAG
jgi:hypothetical protein